MKLLDLIENEEFEAEILEVQPSDYRKIKQSGQFEFDWTKEQGNHVFKIVRLDEEENPQIHGLMSIMDIKEEFRIHINLIENANDNKSPNKKVDRMAGCLISFAIQIAFEKGYYGFTSLIPKTKLIPLYVEKYGFNQFGRQLAIQGKEAIKLIQKYQDDEIR